MHQHAPVILVSAFSINPDSNGNNSPSWKLLAQIGRFNPLIVVTRPVYREAIERAVAADEELRTMQITWVWFDVNNVPNAVRGGRLHRAWWQRALPGFVLKQKLSFDVVHDMSPGAIRTPSRLWKLGKPFVFGPVGRQRRVPKNYLIHVYGWRAWLGTELRWRVDRILQSRDRALHNSMRHANYLITFDREVDHQNYGSQAPVLHMPVAGCDSGISEAHRGEHFTVVASGPLRPEAGFDLCIRSFARYYHQLSGNEKLRSQLVIIGDGPLAAYLQGLAAEMEISSAVKFIPWLHATDQRALFAESSVFFSSAHQSRCDQLSLALSCGLPVVCFRDGVCGDFVSTDCGVTIRQGRYDTTITRFSEALRLLHTNPTLHARLSEGARRLFSQQFSWEAKGQKLNSIYRQLAGNPA